MVPRLASQEAAGGAAAVVAPHTPRTGNAFLVSKIIISDLKNRPPQNVMGFPGHPALALGELELHDD